MGLSKWMAFDLRKHYLMLFRLNTQAQFDVIECQSISIQQGWTNALIDKFWNQYRFVLITVLDQEKKCIESLMCIG